MKTKVMTEGKPFSLILKFALPLMLGSVFQEFYTVTDTIIVGQFLGVGALAAIGAVGWICFLRRYRDFARDSAFLRHRRSVQRIRKVQIGRWGILFLFRL